MILKLPLKYLSQIKKPSITKEKKTEKKSENQFAQIKLNRMHQILKDLN